jgi:FkbM family methyltransferase
VKTSEISIGKLSSPRGAPRDYLAIGFCEVGYTMIWPLRPAQLGGLRAFGANPPYRTDVMHLLLATICHHTFLSILDCNSVVIDLGANQGAFSHEIIKRFGCTVFAAEPIKSVSARIGTHPRLMVLNCGIGKETGEAIINVFRDRCASLLPPRPNEAATGEKIEVVTFSRFLSLTGVFEVDLLKLDIEGAELDVLDSIDDETLRRIRQITVEFHDFIYPGTARRVDNIRQRLRAAGFHDICFSLDNSDVLFINRSLRVSKLNLMLLRTVVKYARGISRRHGRLFRRT